jgi:hypothetical protein
MAIYFKHKYGDIAGNYKQEDDPFQLHQSEEGKQK